MFQPPLARFVRRRGWHGGLAARGMARRGWSSPIGCGQRVTGATRPSRQDLTNHTAHQRRGARKGLQWGLRLVVSRWVDDLACSFWESSTVSSSELLVHNFYAVKICFLLTSITLRQKVEFNASMVFLSREYNKFTTQTFSSPFSPFIRSVIADQQYRA